VCSPPPRHYALGILLKGPMGGHFLMSELPLFHLSLLFVTK